MHVCIWVDGQVVYAGGTLGGRQQTQFLQRKVLPMCTKDKNNNKIQGLNKEIGCSYMKLKSIFARSSFSP